MVKFTRELEAQLIPEWKDAFVSYRQLKKHVKKIKLSLQHPPLFDASVSAEETHRFGFSILDVLRTKATGSSPADLRSHGNFSVPADEDSTEELEPVQSREEEETGFFITLEEELEKVNNFYKSKESEFCERAEVLSKQLQILLDLKQILDEHHRRRHKQCSTSPDSSSIRAAFLARRDSSSLSDRTSEADCPISSDGSKTPVSEEVIAALERNGISFVGSARSKAKKGMKAKAATMRIDIPASTPGKTISAISSMVWEDLVNGARKDRGGGDYINRKKIQCAEKMIRGAFVELYRGLGLLKSYSSLNMVAFSKILKKYIKVSKNQASGCYLKKVKRSQFVSSDKVVKLADEVESIFTKHFAGNDRRKAMKFLRPNQPKESHAITFFVGLFTGSFLTLFSVYAVLAHMSGIFSSFSQPGYMETVYPVFSIFALLSLHIFLYGCNIFLWKRCRINHNFIFDFNPATAFKFRDAFLICASFMTMVVAALVVHLILRSSNFAPQLVDAIPGTLLLIFLGTLICPCNIFYRSTRYCFLRVMRNIICSPFYRVLMADFFMADQLTSQIPLMRHMEFTSCYFIAGGFKIHPYQTCTNNKNYKFLAYIISFLPYYCRAMQCVRRYIEEGYDINHLANAGKYVAAMLAAATRLKYAVDPTLTWLAVVVFTSTMATFYQLYWDFVKDWGLLNRHSVNLFLRDDLILKRKCIYYFALAFNFVLRLAWIETVLRLNMGPVENRLVDFLLASLEIIRRGHWNFYRLENEHLNNIGKFRAIKAVPLPFRDME